MKSYKEYNDSKLSEAVTIHDNIWTYLNKEIDGLFEKLKKHVKDMAMPHRDYSKNIQKWLYEKRYGTNENANHKRIQLSLSEYRNINSLLSKMESALRETDGEDFRHVDDMIDLYKNEFKEIIKSLFARIKVNRKNGTAAATAATAAVPSSLATKPTASPIASPPAAEERPAITRPLVEPEEDESTYKFAADPAVTPPPKLPTYKFEPFTTSKLPKEPSATPHHLHPTEKPTMAPTEKPTMAQPTHSPSEEPDVHAPFDAATDRHAKAQEDELVKLGIAASYVRIYGLGEDEALDQADEILGTIEPEKRPEFIRLGQEYIRTHGGAKPAMAAYGVEAPAEEDKERARLLGIYRTGEKGQRTIRRLIKNHAPELIAGSNIKGYRVETIIDSYLKKMRAAGELPGPGEPGDGDGKRKRKKRKIKESVEYYRDLLRNPNRTLYLLDEAEKIESIQDRVEFYRSKLRMARS